VYLRNLFWYQWQSALKLLVLKKYTFLSLTYSLFSYFKKHDAYDNFWNGHCDLCSLNGVVAVFSGGVTIVLKFCNPQFL